MRINRVKKLYLAIGIAGASVLVNGVTVHAQTTESSAENVGKIKSSLEEMSVAKDYDSMLQSSEPQTLNNTSNTGTLVAQFDGNTLPSQTTPTTPNTLPSDTTQPTTPNTLPGDTTQPTTPNTLPSDITQPTTPNTLPSDTTPNTLPNDNIQQTTPDNIPSDTTQPTIPSDGNDPSLRDTQPTIPSDGNTPTDGSDPASNIDPGRATRSGSSYIGVGGNIGIGGNTGVGEGSFSVISKIGLTNNISVRPAALFGDQTSILLPVTLDFAPADLQVSNYNIAPYVGAGAVISTGDNNNVGFLLTGGVDVPITTQLTATAGLNVGFVDGTDVGLVIGVGYNFAGL